MVDRVCCSLIPNQVQPQTPLINLFVLVWVGGWMKMRVVGPALMVRVANCSAVVT